VSSFFQRLFGRSTPPPASQEAETIPVEESTELSTAAEKPAGPKRWQVGYAHSVGLQREHNEDSLFTLTTELVYEDKSTNFGFYVVADGMGGHLNGEAASALAVRTMADYVIQHIMTPPLLADKSESNSSVLDLLANGIQEANRNVQKEVPGGGTTMTAVILLEGEMLIAHVGDSRVYQVDSDWKIQSLTRDHSFVQQLVDSGQITAREAEAHPHRNMLYLAVGQWEPLQPDLLSRTLPAPGYLLICSDGLWGVVPDEKIRQIIKSAVTPLAASRLLVEAANQAGGPDNISAIVVRILS
jgi:serine/threonine protein phosphatase PrpC